MNEKQFRLVSESRTRVSHLQHVISIRDPNTQMFHSAELQSDKLCVELMKELIELHELFQKVVCDE